MNLKLIFLFFFTSLVGNAQCDAIINWKYKGVVNLYDKPNGQKIKAFKNDQKNENFLSLYIEEEKGNFFKVNISYEIEHKPFSAWIKKNNYIGAFAKHGQEFIDITLYDKPSIKESKKMVLKKWKSGFITIIKCLGNWTQITIIYNGKQITGWIKPNKLCTNNYSTCN